LGGMRAVNMKAGRVLDILTRDLALGDGRKIDNAPGAFQAVHVDHVNDTPLGPVFAVAHYFEQNGDLVADPDVTFLCGGDGRWYPLAFQNALGYRRAAEVRSDGELLVNRARQSDLAGFCGTWMKNVAEQQDLGRGGSR